MTRPPIVRGTILIATFLMTVCGGSSASALIVSVQPAWDGWVRADRPTEVAIRVVGADGGELTLTLDDSSTRHVHNAILEPDVQFVWRVRLSGPSGDSLQLRAQLDRDPGVEREFTLRRHLAPSPLVAVVADRPIALDGIQTTTLHVGVEALPWYDSSYAAMDLVLIHRDSLRAMARQQLIALRQHAARCGRLVLVDFAAADADRFAEVAGCGGRLLVAADTGTGLGARVADLLGTPVPQLPSPGSLQVLLDDHGMARLTLPVVVFFTIYLGVLLLAVRSQRAPVYFLSASITASLIGWFAWTHGPEQIDRVAWTEMEGRATVARFTSLLRVLGGGGAVTVEVPDEGGPLQPLQPMNLLVASDHGGDGGAGMSFDTRLFSRHEFVASGVTPMSAPLNLDQSGDVPRIFNPHDGESPPALLAWNDRRYSVPPLAPAEDWRPPSSPEPWGASRAEQLFRQRAMTETAALLLEYSADNWQPDAAARGYLMVRP